jgi:pantothenate kinase
VSGAQTQGSPAAAPAVAPATDEASVGDVVTDLVSRATRLLAARSRVLIGVVGAPGAGKSTATSAVAAALTAQGASCAVVPMDGFHLAQRELQRLGRADRKGAPDTFDAAGYVALLRRLREGTDDVVYAPEYVRGAVEQPVGSAVPVPRDVAVVLTEGNYLLLDDGPWAAVRPLLDETWYLDVDDAVRRSRLYARHLANGKTPELATAFTDGSDERNARLVAAGRDRADVQVAWS